MAAPKGNKFALGHNKGRPRMYETPEDLLVAAECYFEWVEANPLYKYDVIKSGDRAGEELKIALPRPFTEIAMCHYMELTMQSYHTTYKENEVFSDVTTHLSNCIRNQKYEGAAVGLFNANIIARDLGLTDKQEIHNTGETVKNTITFNGVEIEI